MPKPGEFGFLSRWTRARIVIVTFRLINVPRLQRSFQSGANLIAKLAIDRRLCFVDSKNLVVRFRYLSELGEFWHVQISFLSVVVEQLSFPSKILLSFTSTISLAKDSHVQRERYFFRLCQFLLLQTSVFHPEGSLSLTDYFFSTLPSSSIFP